MNSSSGEPRLATVTIPAPDVRPGAFLDLAAGRARGFWARGGRWVAHCGAVAEIESGPQERGDRFAGVETEAVALAKDPVLPDRATRAPVVRFYGGFSFREDHRPEGAWRGFSPALFHLPEFEVEGDDSGDAWLRARALVRPEEVEGILASLRRRAEALRADLTALGSRGLPGGVGRVEGPGAATHGMDAREAATNREAWEGAVEECLDAIRGGLVSKVVLARHLDIETEGRVDPARVVENLWEINRGSHVFLFEPVPGSALVGAAPETVATLRDGVFHATAVAGSIGRGRTPREQAELAARLLASEKDRSEQRIALEDMVVRLETVAHQIRTDPQPHVLTLARIQHLETEIRASVPVGTGILDVLRLLHPTPAVCGLPRDAALDFLAREEPFRRGWYAGPVGWFDGDGNGIFAPALRSAVVQGTAWRLFAGAGIVEGSVPASEWEETRLKFTPVLEALWASGVRVPGHEDVFAPGARERPGSGTGRP